MFFFFVPPAFIQVTACKQYNGKRLDGIQVYTSKISFRHRCSNNFLKNQPPAFSVWRLRQVFNKSAIEKHCQVAIIFCCNPASMLIGIAGI